VVVVVVATVKDWANPFIAAHFSRLLRRLGVRTVGVGHFFTLDRARFDGDFDVVLGGEPSPSVISAVTEQTSGYIAPEPMPLDVVPVLVLSGAAVLHGFGPAGAFRRTGHGVR
jgi:hypothetical protein